MVVGLGGVPWLFGQGCRPQCRTPGSQRARELPGCLIALGHDIADLAGVGVGRDCQAEDGGEAEEDDQK